MNVSGWREEPASLSPLSERLVRWMCFQPDSQSASDEIAAALALAWLDLTDATAVAIWVDGAGTGQLELQGRAGEADGNPEPGIFVTATLESWPTASFWTIEGEGASRDLASQLGMLSDKISAPSLCVPLGDFALALLWLQSDDGRLGDEWKPIIEAAAIQSAAHFENALRIEKMGRSFHGIAEAVAQAIDGRETHREGHSHAVAYYSGLIAREMNFDEADLEKIEFAALWHGLGRLSVPDALLQKESPLSAEELETVRGAAACGAEKLARVEGLSEIAEMVRHQNERFDGSGAPDGLGGMEIPLGSRVIAVAARFAAMTNRRADRAPMSVVGGAMESMASASGSALDPEVVAAFLRAMGRTI